jgi:hypothetical protein
MSKDKQENDHPVALAMIEELCQRYPKTFTHESHDVRPLARGIHKAIVADAPDLPGAVRKAQEARERPRQAAGREAQSAKGEAATVMEVFIAAKAETVEQVAAKAEATTVKQPAATGQVTPAKGETATRQDPAKAGPERLSLAGLKAAAQRRRLAASTS